MKKIAILTGNRNREIMIEFLHGVHRYAAEHGDSVFVFNCFVGKSDGIIRNGEYNIYKLPDWEYFDGIIVEGNIIDCELLRDNMQDIIDQSGKPILITDYPFLGMKFLGIDNYAAFGDMITHLIKVHGCRKIAFLEGPEWHSENRERRRAYLDTMKKYALPCDESMIFQGDFHEQSGTDAVEKMLAEKILPEAIACANDDMTFGVCKALEKHGIRVPEDILVTGFDGIRSARDFAPSVTTIDRHHEKQGYQAMGLIQELVNGRKCPDFTHSEYELAALESCGCLRDTKSFTHQLRRRQHDELSYRNNYLEQQDILHEAMLEASDMESLTQCMVTSRSMFGDGEVFVCFNKDFYDNVREGKREYRDFGYPDEFYVMTDGQKLMEKTALFDYLAEKAKGKGILSLYPLHYKDRSFGFIAFTGFEKAIEEDVLKGTVTLFELSIENTRAKAILHDYNIKLDELYVRDSLTGLYNRFGFERWGGQILCKNKSLKHPMSLMFIDLDGLKAINDSFGHELGDYAIKTAAAILKKVRAEGQIAVRYGGDEFLIFGAVSCPDEERQFRRQIREELDQRNEAKAVAFRLDMSIGYILIDPEEEHSLYAYVKEADAMMYAEKNRKKTKES